jgi:hypothetical protein
MEDVPFETIWALEAPEGSTRAGCPRRPARLGDDERVDEHRRAREHSLGLELSAERRVLLAKGRHAMRTRRLSDEIPWVACRFPDARARTGLADVAEGVRGFPLWSVSARLGAEAARMAKIKERFDRASEVRIVGAGRI